jgi:hypothetical protein
VSGSDIVFDFGRSTRIGLDEAVFCEGKSAEQIAEILGNARERNVGLLLTRLDAGKLSSLPPEFATDIDYCPLSRTAFFGPLRPVVVTGKVAIVAAGTSDAGVAREAARTLRHAGVEANLITDVGVAGLWRLMDRIEEIGRHPIVIAVAGMDAALASVLGGLVPGVPDRRADLRWLWRVGRRSHGPQRHAGKLRARDHGLQYRQRLRRGLGRPANTCCHGDALETGGAATPPAHAIRPHQQSIVSAHQGRQFRA